MKSCNVQVKTSPIVVEKFVQQCRFWDIQNSSWDLWKKKEFYSFRRIFHLLVYCETLATGLSNETVSSSRITREIRHRTQWTGLICIIRYYFASGLHALGCFWLGSVPKRDKPHRSRNKLPRKKISLYMRSEVDEEFAKISFQALDTETLVLC